MTRRCHIPPSSQTQTASFRRMGRLAALAAAVWPLAAGAATFSAAPISGGFLTQPTGRSSCITEDGASHCLAGHGFGSSFGITVDATGQHAYVTSFNQPNGAGHALGSLVELDRFPTAASLLQSASPAS